MQNAAWFIEPAKARTTLSRGKPAHDITFISKPHIAGLKVNWAILDGEIGRALVAVCNGAICWLGLSDKGEKEMLCRFKADWEQADLIEKELPLMRKALSATPPALPLLLVGTEFELSVWEKLLTIPRGQLVRYGDIATVLKKPNAARAVGNAVGSNPVTWLVPCHRVGHANGSLKGFAWGEACKRRLLGLEIAA